jgi:uncharacterized protein GlcG (DUF336 family)
MKKQLAGLTLALLSSVIATQANAACSDFTYSTLQNIANNVVRATAPAANTNGTGGFGLNMWATVVDETGKVCEVVNTGTKGDKAGNSQWLGSRVISAQKANTANAFSLDGVSISTGALYAAVQPGGSLYGLQESNPVDAAGAYSGNPISYGTAVDALRGKRVGGVNVFGGGIALYKAGKKVGAIGVSGDTSCTDHAFAWKMREALGMAPVSLAADFEKLTLTDSFGALGDHPHCANDSVLASGTGGFGFVASPVAAE